MNKVSFGGGVNSSGMLLGMYEKGIPCDLILFADPGGEKPETYKHRDEFSEWLVAHGYPPITTVREERWTLEENCLNRKRLPSIVLGLRDCSDKWKIRPQKRYMAAYQPAVDAWARGEKIINFIGFDAGEPWRANDRESKQYEYRYLLIEWGWGREECIDAFGRHGLPVPPKSSCFFCPEMREWEIVELNQNHPDLAARAVAMEHNNTTLHGVKGLKRTTSFEAIIDYYNRQGVLPILGLPPRIPCTCYDGE